MKLRLIIVVSTIFFFSFLSCGFDDDYHPVSHAMFLKTHPYNVGQQTLMLQDEKRDRPLKTEVWYPTLDTTKYNITEEYPFKLPPTSKEAAIITGKRPLIMLSHGTGGNRISQMWLACELAGNGYIVAAVDHFGNTLDNKIPKNFVKVWDRPLDIRFAMDHLLTHPDFVASIDTGKIGMAGFSLGGYTAIALAGGVMDYEELKVFSTTTEGKSEFLLPELGDVSKLITPALVKEGNTYYKNLKDNRIKAFVAMAPAIGQGFEQAEQFSQVNRPLLIIGTENDQRTPVETNAKHYHHLIEGSEYWELPGKVGHYVFMNDARRSLRRNAPLIFKDDKSVNRKEIHQLVAGKIMTFFTEHFN